MPHTNTRTNPTGAFVMGQFAVFGAEFLCQFKGFIGNHQHMVDDFVFIVEAQAAINGHFPGDKDLQHWNF